MYFRCVNELRVPAWYDLEVIDGGRGIFLKVERGAADQLFGLLATSPFVKSLEKNLQVPSFIAPSPLPWGYGPVLRSAGTDGLWEVIECDLPALFSDSGDNTYSSEERWNRATGLSATWMLLSSLLAHIGANYTSSLHLGYQLLEMDLGTRCDQGIHSCPISAGISSETRFWLERHGEGRFPAIGECMLNAHHRLRGVGKFDQFVQADTYAEIHHYPARLTLRCEGDRCSLYSDWTSAKRCKGFELYCHNVDTPVQQFVLLIGLAAFNHLARGKKL